MRALVCDIAHTLSLSYHAWPSNHSVVFKEGVAQTSSLRSPLAGRIAASAGNDVDQADLPAGECRELQLTASTTDQVHAKGWRVNGNARYLLPAGSLLLPGFLKL